MRRFPMIVALLHVAACTATPVADPFTVEGRVWPAAPAMQRIAYIGEFSSSSDLGLEPTAWDRFINFTAGSEADVMVRPMAVVTSDDGRVIYVADPDTRCVHQYDLDRSRYRCLMVGRRQMLVSPIGLAARPDGRVYIADSQMAAIYLADPGDKYVRRFETSVQLVQPTGIAWDRLHELLFVTDTGSQSIKVFDHRGILVSEFGERGNGKGEFNFPTYLWFDPHDHLLVTDSLNFRIQRFGDDGAFLHEFGENGDRVGYFARPKGLATDSYGHVYVIDALMNVMQVFNRAGEFLIAVGQQGQGPGEFWLPNGIFISGDNTIYVADSRNKRVQVFRYIGPET